MFLFRRSKDPQKKEAKKLRRKQLKKFYIQELFGDYAQMKKYLLIIMALSGSGELGKVFFLPDDAADASTLEQKAVLYTSFIFGAILYAAAFLKRLERDTTKYIVIRCVMLSLANLSIFVYMIAHCIYYFENENFGLNALSLMNGIAFFSTSAYLPLVMDLLNPIWYAKIVIPLGYYIGLLVGAYHIEGDFVATTWVRTGIAIMNIMMVGAFKDHFRWKLFKKRSKDEAFNKIHEQILHHVPSPIAVFDVEGKIVYSNHGFKNLCDGSFESFSKKIVKLNQRREHKDVDDSDININVPAKSNCIHKDFKHFKSVSNGKQIGNLQELLQIACKLFGEKRLDETAQSVFDGKFDDNEDDKIKINENLIEEKKYTSFEVTLSFMSEYRRIILILRDTTQQGKILALESNNSYKDRLLASVSHELRTPLNGNLSLIEGATGSDEVPDHIKQDLLIPAYRSGKLLLHLINDILDFSQITAKKLRLSFDQLNLQETIKSCYQLVELQAKRKGIDLRVFIDARLSEFSTDHDRVKQIILNLVNNAIKFTFKGSVTLEATQINPSCVQITVKDTGVGIKRENVNKLFKEFTRIDDPEHENINSKGVGLGLTIAFKLAKRLGPKSRKAGIRVKSEYGKGSSFSFILVDQLSSHPTVAELPDLDWSLQDIIESPENLDSPELTNEKQFVWSTDNLCLISLQTNENTQVDLNVKKYTTAPKTSRKNLIKDITPHTDVDPAEPLSPTLNEYQPMLSPGRKKRVLIVDDEPFNILAIESFIKGLNIQTDAAFNGKDAVEKILDLSQHSDFYDLIFMDCQMPIMDGYEATKTLIKMMERRDIPETPIIACTAFSTKEAIENCFKVGMKEVLKKPLSRAKLEGVMKTYLE